MPLLYKVGMGGKIIVCTMLQDKITLAAEDRVLPVENLVRERVNALKLVWRIGENEVELAGADFQEIEDVAVDCADFFQAQTFVHLAYERGVFAVHFHAYGLFSASGDEFSAYAACTSEEVQQGKTLQLIFALQDVEKTLFGKIRGRPGGVTCRRVDGFSLEFSSDYSHAFRNEVKRLVYMQIFMSLTYEANIFSWESSVFPMRLTVVC